MIDTSTFRFFVHVEVDGLQTVPSENIQSLRLPDPRHLEQLEQLRVEFLQRWQAGEPLEQIVKRAFAVPLAYFLPAEPMRYIPGYNVSDAFQARVFGQAMRDLDRYIAALSQFCLRVRVLSVAQPLPEHPEGYTNLQDVLNTLRYLGDGLWLKAVNDFERQRRTSLCWRYLPSSLAVDGAAPEYMADALELLLYKAQIVRILVSDPVQETRDAVIEGADEYLIALSQLVQAVQANARRRTRSRLAVVNCRSRTATTPR